MSSRNAPPRGALRDDTRNGCVADYLKASIRDFKAKWGRDSGLKVGTMWNAENNPWDYGIEQKFGSGRMTELKNPMGTLTFVSAMKYILNDQECSRLSWLNIGLVCP